MLDLDALHRQVETDIKNGLDKNHFTLGHLIDALERVPDKGANVGFDFGYMHPTTFASWRGVYAHLAIGYAEQGVYPTVQALLDAANEANGKTFTGWKGGEFAMDRSTPLWVANTGESPHTAICGVEFNGYRVVLHTFLDEF